jgi:ribosomal protein L22
MADEQDTTENNEPEAPAAEAKPKPKRAAAKPKAAAAKADAGDDAEAKPKPKRAAAKPKAAAAKADAGEDAAEEKPKPKRAAAKPKADESAAAEEPKAKAPAKPKASAKPKAEAKSAAPSRPVVRAQAKYVRSSARKARIVCDHLRGKSVEDARAILAFTPRAVARDWSKVLESAIANAEHNHELVGEDLMIKAVHADEGPTLKRFRPRAMGRATPIRKRTSHLTILLTPKE